MGAGNQQQQPMGGAPANNITGNGPNLGAPQQVGIQGNGPQFGTPSTLGMQGNPQASGGGAVAQPVGPSWGPGGPQTVGGQGSSYGPGQLPPTMGQPAQQTGGGVAPGLNTAYQANTNIAGGGNLNAANNAPLQSYYNAAAQPLIQQFQQSTDPSILGNAVTSGNLFSSAPQQQETNAQTALAQGLGNLGANIYEPAYQAALGQQEQAIANQPALAQGQYIPSQELAGVGSQQQQLQQQIMNYPMQMLSGLAGLVGPGTGASGSQITFGTQPGSMK